MYVIYWLIRNAGYFLGRSCTWDANEGAFVVCVCPYITSICTSVTVIYVMINTLCKNSIKFFSTYFNEYIFSYKQTRKNVNNLKTTTIVFMIKQITNEIVE